MLEFILDIFFFDLLDKIVQAVLKMLALLLDTFFYLEEYLLMKFGIWITMLLSVHFQFLQL